MHLPPLHIRRHAWAELRDRLRAARETYRTYSGAAIPEPAAPSPAVPARPARHEQPDVVLDVPDLHVDEIDLQLDELKARVALEARVLDLLHLDVGVDAELRGVGLTIKGVDAEAHLRVRLDNLTVILDRVMNTIDRNPRLLERLSEHLGATLDELGAGTGSAVGDIGSAAHALASEIAPPNGHPQP